MMSTGMVSLGIATAYERYYGVLKRLGSSPLPRWGLLAAKVLAVLALEVGADRRARCIGLAVFSTAGASSELVLRPLLVVLLGTLTFAALGLLMAGALRAEATLAGANGLYLIFLLIGGIVLPVDHLPGFLQVPARILPPRRSPTRCAARSPAAASPVRTCCCWRCGAASSWPPPAHLQVGIGRKCGLRRA